MDNNNVPSGSPNKRSLNEDSSSVVAKRTKLNEEPEINIESCPICLLPTEKKFVGRPENCSHKFCLSCIKRWSRRKRTCPVCRSSYRSLVVHERYSRRPIRNLPIGSKRSGKVLVRRHQRTRNLMLNRHLRQIISFSNYIVETGCALCGIVDRTCFWCDVVYLVCNICMFLGYRS